LSAYGETDGGKASPLAVYRDVLAKLSALEDVSAERAADRYKAKLEITTAKARAEYEAKVELLLTEARAEYDAACRELAAVDCLLYEHEGDSVM
jgi:hypothetical protein